jgi:hypothetical protein
MSTHTIQGRHSHRAPRQRLSLLTLLRRHRRAAPVSEAPPEVTEPPETAAPPEGAQHGDTPVSQEDHAAIGRQLVDGVLTIADRALREQPLPDWTRKPGTGGASVTGRVWEHGWPAGEPDTRPQPRADYGDLLGPAPAPDGPVPERRPGPRSVAFSAASEPTVNLTRVDTGIGRPFSPEPDDSTEPSTWLRSLDPDGSIAACDIELRGDPLFTRLAPAPDGGLLAELDLGESPARQYRLATGSGYLRKLAAASLRAAGKLDAAEAEAAGTGGEDTAATGEPAGDDVAQPETGSEAAPAAEPGTADEPAEEQAPVVADAEAEPADAPGNTGPVAPGTDEPGDVPADSGPDGAQQLEQEIFTDQEKLAELTRGGPVVEQQCETTEGGAQL